MISLATTIAARRGYYPRPVRGLPDILMIDIPRRFAPQGLALKRFYPIMVETVEEQAELDAFLALERDAIVALDILDKRPSTLPAKHLTIAHFGPPGRGWPFVQLCQWPRDFVAKAEKEERVFARGAYTFELFLSREWLERASRVLLASLDERHAVNVEIVVPDWSAPPDSSSH